MEASRYINNLLFLAAFSPLREASMNGETNGCILERNSSHIQRVNIGCCSNCTARQCSPLRRKFMECFIINQALSLLMKHLVFGQRQKAHNFSAFHWSSHGSLVSVGQYFATTRVVHLPKRTETS